MERPGVLSVVVSSLLAFALGAVAGVVTTFAHRAYVLDVGVPIPVGLIVGLFIVVALVVGFRLAFGRRTLALAAAIGVIAAIAVLTLPGRNGSVLVVDDPLGYVWAIGPVLVAAAALLWPARQTSSIETPAH